MPGCFGEMDAKSAIHPLDERKARRDIGATKAAQATFEDFEKVVVWHCYRREPRASTQRSRSSTLEAIARMAKPSYA